VRFGEVVRNANEQEPDPLEASIERYVGLEHLDPGSLHIKRWGLVGQGTTFTRKFSKGQVLFPKRRVYQCKVAVAEFAGVCSGDILVLEANSDHLLPDLLPFIAESDAFFEHALQTSAGSLSPRTRWKDLARYEFSLPPKEEQRRIAEILWAADQTVQALDKVWQEVSALLAAARCGVFGRLLRHEKGLAFGSICRGSTQNGLSVPKDDRLGTIGMVNMGELFASEVIHLDGLEKVTLSENQCARFLLRPGDLLFARRSIVLEGAGKCSMVPELDAPTTFESSIIRATLDSDVALPRFYLHFFNSGPGKEGLRRITRPGAVAGVAGSDIRKIEVPLPPLATQVAVVGSLDAIQRRLGEVEAHRARALSLLAATRETLIGEQSRHRTSV
jgi:type I restriction enzyme S subunit